MTSSVLVNQTPFLKLSGLSTVLGSMGLHNIKLSKGLRGIALS